MSAARRDAAARYLGLVIRLLPPGRGAWGRAMQAELETLGDRAERRRFALSCTRAAALPSAKAAAGSSPATVIAGGLAVLAALTATEAIGPIVPTLLLLAALAWLARRSGPFGPVRPQRSARAVRLAGWAVVGAFLSLALADGGLAGALQPTKGGALLTLLLSSIAASALALTALGSRLEPTGLIAGTTAGVIAASAAFVALPFERIGTPLAHGLPLHGTWLALVAFGAPVAAALLTARDTGRADQAVMAVLCAGASAALLVALLGLGAIQLFPHSIPDIVGPLMPTGSSAAARQAENAIEASDPYAGLWVFGALLAALLWVMARPPSRAGVTAGLLFALGLPPIYLGASARDFPGATAIAFATLATVGAAIATTRQGKPRSR